MAKSVDPSQNALDRLHALRAEKPATQMGQIRWAWPEISAALARGHSLTTIHQRLNEVGIHIPYKRLSLYIGRLRRQDAGRPPAPITPSPGIAVQLEAPTPVPSRAPLSPLPPSDRIADPATQQPAGRDPLANLRKYANTRPAFHWDEAPPDKDKLF